MACVRLREDVFMARADGLLVFLDLGADRYFALNSEFSARLAPVIEANGEGADPDMIRRLCQAGAVVDGGEAPGVHAFAATTWPPATDETPSAGVGVVSTMSAALCRWRAERALVRRHIATIVRSRRAMRSHARARSADQDSVVRSAAMFAGSRALRGGRDACLKEALALLYFLGPGGMAAEWVFAVKGAPFAAHCWIQLGGVVLNDSVENVRPYTPIMVV